MTAHTTWDNDPPSELRKFVAPEFLFGPGARFQAGHYAARLGIHHLLLVTDGGVLDAGWAEEVRETVQEAGVGCSVFSGVHPNPRTEDIEAGGEAYRAVGADGLLAVGGGSPIDCAKGIGIVVSHRGPIVDFEGVDRIETPLPPLLCVPTTAGSSADISQFAILSHSAERRKIAVVSKALVPDLSLVDPDCTVSMDPFLTACTGLDVLTHAVEAFVSTGHGPITDLHALEAIRLVHRHLEHAITRPDAMEHRTGMALASLQAGLAFSNASLGAVHAMAHVLGGRFDLPHGECNALLLEHVLIYNLPAVPERCRHIARALDIPAENLSLGALEKALEGALEAFRSRVGIPARLQEGTVDRRDLPALARDALRDICIVTNPRVPSLEDLEALYGRIL